MHFGSLLLVCFSGLGFAAVQIKQYTFQKIYEVGDTAILYCNLTNDNEALRGCKMMWQICNENSKDHVDISEIPKYHHRINIKSQATFTSMTINDLMVTDTENILCTAVCLVNGKIRYITGNGTILIITEQEPKPEPSWLKYLIFSINLLIFTIALGIFILIIRKRSRRKRLQN